MTDERKPAGFAIAITFLAIAVITLIPAMIGGGWWNLLLIATIPFGLFGLIGLAIELSRKGKS